MRFFPIPIAVEPMSQPAVTIWLGFLKAGDAAAAEALWRRYYTDLVEQARQHLSRQVRRAAAQAELVNRLLAKLPKDRLQCHSTASFRVVLPDRIRPT